MAGEVERPDPTRQRITHADRERVAEVLREAAGDGRLDLDELDQRLAATYAARTYAELTPLTLDLANQRDHTPGPQRHRAVLKGLDRSGVWVVPSELKVVAVLGSARLDLRQATWSAQEVVLTINAFLGGATVIVNPRTNVVIEGTGFMGGYSGPSGLVAAKPDAASPTVRIRGRAVWGGVSVERKH